MRGRATSFHGTMTLLNSPFYVVLCVFVGVIVLLGIITSCLYMNDALCTLLSAFTCHFEDYDEENMITVEEVNDRLENNAQPSAAQAYKTSSENTNGRR